jgi:hypothetical protein
MQHRGVSIARHREGADASNASAVMEVRNITTTTTRKYYEPLVGESCGCFYHVACLTLIHSSLTGTHTPLSLSLA